MEDILKEYLISLGLVEFFDLLKEAFRIFDEAERDYEFVFEEILHTADHGDSGEDIDRMRYYVDSTLRDICSGYGVYLSDDVTLRVMVDIVRGLQSIESYEDKSELRRIFETDMDELERAVMLLNLVTPYRESTLTEYIAQGNLSYMGDNIILGTEDETPPIDEIKAKERIIKFMHFCIAKRKPVSLLAAIKNGFPLGQSMTIYVGALEQIDHMESLEDVAYNLIAACLASNDGGESAIIVCKPYYELFAHSLEEATHLNTYVNELAKEFTVHGQI